jgi:hypothetical protein
MNRGTPLTPTQYISEFSNHRIPQRIRQIRWRIYRQNDRQNISLRGVTRR